jgi:hypothetical protein
VWGGEGMGGQHFGRRQTLDWPLTVQSLYAAPVPLFKIAGVIVHVHLIFYVTLNFVLLGIYIGTMLTPAATRAHLILEVRVSPL